MSVQIPEHIKELVTAVEQILGPEAGVVLVGGSVRDIILGLDPKDYDFATSLLPDEVEARVRAAGKRAYTVGKRYGTIGFKHDRKFIEVTTYRSELYDLSSRKPQVTFTEDLQADLSRRDFTMNAVAISAQGEVFDPHDGQADIAAGRIRSVGSAKERFREDPLRMLRLIRFVGRYGFQPDPETTKAVQEFAYRLNKISRERVSTEMDGILVAPHVEKALQLMAELGLVSFAVPLLAVQYGYDQNSPFHSFDLWNHTLKTLTAVEPAVETRWAALLHDVGKPFVRQNKPGRSTYVHHDLIGERLVEMTALDLKWSTARRTNIAGLVRDHLSDDSPLRPADNGAK